MQTSRFDLDKNLQLQRGVFGEPVCIGKKKDHIPGISRLDGVKHGEKMKVRKLDMRVNTYVPCTRFITSAAMRGSISIAVTCFAWSRILTVRFPVPGPTSSTLSVGFRFV